MAYRSAPLSLILDYFCKKERREKLIGDFLNTQVSTSWLMYSYSASDPMSDADISFANNPHGSKPVYLMHRSQFADDELPSDVKVWDLRNYQVTHRFQREYQSSCACPKAPTTGISCRKTKPLISSNRRGKKSQTMLKSDKDADEEKDISPLSEHFIPIPCFRLGKQKSLLSVSWTFETSHQSRR